MTPEQAMNSRRGRGQDTLRPHWPWSRSVPIQFASRCRRSHWWSPRRKTETVQNLSNDVRRMDRCHNFHTPQTARVFQNVKLENSHHEVSPGVVAARKHLFCAPVRFSRIVDAWRGLRQGNRNGGRRNIQFDTRFGDDPGPPFSPRSQYPVKSSQVNAWSRN